MNQICYEPSGENVKTLGIIDYVKNGALYVNAEARAVCVTSEDDLEALPADYPPGSVAFTAGCAHMWQLAADGTWTEV